jgi:hypothetical protein
MDYSVYMFASLQAWEGSNLFYIWWRKAWWDSYTYEYESHYFNSIFSMKTSLFWENNDFFNKTWAKAFRVAESNGITSFRKFLSFMFFRQTIYRFGLLDPESLQSSFIKNCYFLKIGLSLSKKLNWNNVTLTRRYRLNFQSNSKYVWATQHPPIFLGAECQTWSPCIEFGKILHTRIASFILIRFIIKCFCYNDYS